MNRHLYNCASKNKARGVILGALVFLICPFAQSGAVPGDQNRITDIAIEWKENIGSGSVEVTNGTTGAIKGYGKNTTVKKNSFSFSHGDRYRIAFSVNDAKTGYGAYPTLVSVTAPGGSFSFFLRDVSAENPIYIPEYGVVVLPAGDLRTYREVEHDIRSRNLLTKTQLIEHEPESSFESVAGKTRRQNVPIWLSTSRDVRLFQITEELEDRGQECKIVQPVFGSILPNPLPEMNNGAAQYMYALGRGVGPLNTITRSLVEGALPIYKSELIDDDVLYSSVTFAAPEIQQLAGQPAYGTDYRVAETYSPGKMFSERQQAEATQQAALFAEEKTKDEMVLYCRTTITNRGDVPRYAWIKTPRPGSFWAEKYPYKFDGTTGLSYFSEDRVFCLSKLNGEPLPCEEIAILLQPRQSAVYDFYLPHTPLSRQRALALMAKSFEQKYDDSHRFWRDKLDNAAAIELPEKRIEQMMSAGLLHLEMITFGREPDGILAPNVGTYSPIGTESSPIIQYYLSMGKFDMAKRSLKYFMEVQRDNGAIQNFGGYMVETGAVLWNIGEYFRYTQDMEWMREITPNLLHAAEYLTKWRNGHKEEESRGRGYGMITGRVADPEDDYAQFMLNAYGYLGMSRTAEILRAIGDPKAAQITQEAADWREDIRETFFYTMAHSPVIPLGDGRWSPTAPPWGEAPGPRLLYQTGEAFFSHGTFTVADAMLGPHYLIFCEVIDPDEPVARMMLESHSELYYQGNSAFSQPYYSKHNWIQAKMGMVKPFLNTYYTTFSAHADRGTYTFWEHLYRLSVHKTHEEGNFLMESRWMLYLEEGDTLKLLNTAPRAWLDTERPIRLKGVRSYFGAVDLEVIPSLDKGEISAAVRCDSDRKPAVVTIRIPHPEGRVAQRVEGGRYDAVRETVSVDNFTGKAEIRLFY